MEEAALADGLCPSCEGRGAVGAPCPAPTCRKRGYHHIPLNFRHVVEAATVDPLVGQRWGDFLVVDRLGRGGVGSVYLALQQPINLPAALKVLGEVEGDAADEARFRAEAAALARLNHPNIVRLLKFGHHGGRPYLVMEFVDGGRTLKSALRQGLSAAHRVEVVLQLVDALEAAHAAGVVHRDIKPDNIMLQALPGRPCFVRLVDFGLAKFVEEGHSTRLLAGTPSYMAPEQLDGRRIGPWSDWYALGCVAFELFTGRRPFPGRSPQEIAALKQAQGYRPTASLQDLYLPPALLEFLEALLAADPEVRLGSAEAVRAGLQAALPRPALLDQGRGRQTLALEVLSQELTERSGPETSEQRVTARHPPVPPPARQARKALALAALLGAGLMVFALARSGESPSASSARSTARLADGAPDQAVEDGGGAGGEAEGIDGGVDAGDPGAAPEEAQPAELGPERAALDGGSGGALSEGAPAPASAPAPAPAPAPASAPASAPAPAPAPARTRRPPPRRPAAAPAAPAAPAAGQALERL